MFAASATTRNIEYSMHQKIKIACNPLDESTRIMHFTKKKPESTFCANIYLHFLLVSLGSHEAWKIERELDCTLMHFKIFLKYNMGKKLLRI